MPKPWVATIGSLKGWLIAVAMCLLPVAIWYAVTVSDRSVSHTVLNQAMREIIRGNIPVQTVIGEFPDPGDAADDYHRAVQECIATQHYSGYMALSAAGQLTDPDSMDDIRAPQYLLAGAPKAHMDYTRRFAQRSDWTVARMPYVRAFDSIGMISMLKADLLAKAGRTDDAEALLKAVLAFGYHIEQERIRYSETITGVGLQRAASRRLVQLYKATNRADLQQAAQQYLESIQHLQERLEAKASSTTARLQDASPPPAELFWLLDNDQDRMWRIEATLLLGLTQWTAPRSADRNASRERLAMMSEQTADPLLQEAALAAREITPQDVRKVR
jgi:hypothetical protein